MNCRFLIYERLSYYSFLNKKVEHEILRRLKINIYKYSEEVVIYTVGINGKPEIFQIQQSALICFLTDIHTNLCRNSQGLYLF